MGELRMKYFVLKPSGKNEYGRASRSAMRMYAREIQNTDPQLAQELLDWAARETPNYVKE